MKVPDPPGSALWPDDLTSLHPLNITHFKFTELQQDDKWLGPLIQYLISNNDISVLCDLCKKDRHGSFPLLNDPLLLMVY